MTAIVGLIDDGVTWIAGDSGSFRGYSRETAPGGKVFRLGECVIGLAGYAMDSQLIRYHLTLPEMDADPKIWMVKKFIPALRAMLKGQGRLMVKDGVERFDSEFLLGLRGRLFRVGGDFFVAERTEGFNAVGCGEEFSYGALYASSGPPKKRLTTALQASAFFSSGVYPPFTFANTKGKEGELTP